MTNGCDHAAASTRQYDRVADLLALQNTVLEAVARGHERSDTLDLLCREVESLTGDVLCTVLLLVGDRMWHGAAPSLPYAFTSAVDGSPIGPKAGSCGTAAFTGRSIEVSDIEHDPLWSGYKSFALPLGLRACWSSPIFSHDGVVLGTFAVYFKEPCIPNEYHREAVRVSTPLAAIVIERSRMEAAEHARIAELAASNARIEQLNHTLELRVAERTSDLNHRNAELAKAFEELQRTHGQLFEAKKLVSLSHLVVGVAHELNTPIGNARILSTTLLERCNGFLRHLDGPIKRSDMSSFVTDVAEGCALLAHSLEVAADRVGRFKAVAVDHSASSRRSFILREVMDDIAALFDPVVERMGCTLVLDVPVDIMLDSYPGPLGQLISNVLDNALEHGLQGREQGHINVCAERLSASHIEVRIHDDGTGIPAGIIDNVFDPFFTTRLADGYSGLGLHVAHQIANGLLGGMIQIESTPASGTLVTVRIPSGAPLAPAA